MDFRRFCKIRRTGTEIMPLVVPVLKSHCDIFENLNFSDVSDFRLTVSCPKSRDHGRHAEPQQTSCSSASFCFRCGAIAHRTFLGRFVYCFASCCTQSKFSLCHQSTDTPTNTFPIVCKIKLLAKKWPDRFASSDNAADNEFEWVPVAGIGVYSPVPQVSDTNVQLPRNHET
jgi:hypothetical protein